MKSWEKFIEDIRVFISGDREEPSVPPTVTLAQFLAAMEEAGVDKGKFAFASALLRRLGYTDLGADILAQITERKSEIDLDAGTIEKFIVELTRELGQLNTQKATLQTEKTQLEAVVAIIKNS